MAKSWHESAAYTGTGRDNKGRVALHSGDVLKRGVIGQFKEPSVPNWLLLF